MNFPSRYELVIIDSDRIYSFRVTAMKSCEAAEASKYFLEYREIPRSPQARTLSVKK
jgi:hypothetical protein